MSSPPVSVGIELLIHSISIFSRDSPVFPSLSVKFEGSDIHQLLPYSLSEKQKVERAFRIIVSMDAFNRVSSWPMTFELSLPVETTPIGDATYDIHAILCDAIASHGCSDTISRSATFKSFRGASVAQMDFEMRAIYFPSAVQKPAIESSVVNPMTSAQIEKICSVDAAKSASQGQRSPRPRKICPSPSVPNCRRFEFVS